MYARTESEVSTISSINTQVSVNFSLASFLVSAAIGVYSNVAFATSLTPAGALAQSYAAPLTLVIAAIFLARGIGGVRRRSRLWGELKSQSQIQ